jgi:hypothetical protein
LKNALPYLLIIVSYFLLLAFGFWLLFWFSSYLVLLASAYRARATFGKPRGVLADLLLSFSRHFRKTARECWPTSCFMQQPLNETAGKIGCFIGAA